MYENCSIEKVMSSCQTTEHTIYRDDHKQLTKACADCHLGLNWPASNVYWQGSCKFPSSYAACSEGESSINAYPIAFLCASLMKRKWGMTHGLRCVSRSSININACSSNNFSVDGLSQGQVTEDISPRFFFFFRLMVFDACSEVVLPSVLMQFLFCGLAWSKSGERRLVVLAARSVAETSINDPQ